MEYIIRKRKKEDCKAIAHVVTIAWNETYHGIVPDWDLANLEKTEQERADKLYNDFDENNNNALVLEVNNKIVGFTNYGKTEDKDYPNCGEIFALYIIKEYQGYGYGRKLVNEAIKELKKMNYDKMLISCLKGNPSNEFYKHIGGKYIKDGVYKRLNLKENVYLYDI